MNQRSQFSSPSGTVFKSPGRVQTPSTISRGSAYDQFDLTPVRVGDCWFDCDTVPRGDLTFNIIAPLDCLSDDHPLKIAMNTHDVKATDLSFELFKQRLLETDIRTDQGQIILCSSIHVVVANERIFHNACKRLADQGTKEIKFEIWPAGSG